jgi:hypothetical protein
MQGEEGEIRTRGGTLDVLATVVRYHGKIDTLVVGLVYKCM